MAAAKLLVHAVGCGTSALARAIEGPIVARRGAAGTSTAAGYITMTSNRSSAPIAGAARARQTATEWPLCR
jgi:hypothetical protein